MITNDVLLELENNYNTGIEYEIALYVSLLPNKSDKERVLEVIKERNDRQKIRHIISYTDVDIIYKELELLNCCLIDCCFETQNDEVGPADIVMKVKDNSGKVFDLGISVKYNNTCNMNVSGKYFLSKEIITGLNDLLRKVYTPKYIQEMNKKYGSVDDWFRKRKRSLTTDEFINILREAVIINWDKVDNKIGLCRSLFHEDSPIEYWIYTYRSTKVILNVNPFKVTDEQILEIELRKYEDSYVGFYLDDIMIGKMQVKFNNGFVESVKPGKRPELIVSKTQMRYGQPFTSWNFNLVNYENK